MVTLTVAGFEVKGRVGVLLEGVQYAVIPGDPLAIPVVMINQGLGADTFRLATEGLPEGWVSIPAPGFRLEPGEAREATLTIKPPRLPDSNAGRHPFRILVASQEASDQSVSIDCALTVAAFTEFEELSRSSPAGSKQAGACANPKSFQFTGDISGNVEQPRGFDQLRAGGAAASQLAQRRIFESRIHCPARPPGVVWRRKELPVHRQDPGVRPTNPDA